MKINFPYLHSSLGKARRYFYYRRGSANWSIKNPHGKPITPNDVGFTAAWELLNAEYKRLAKAEAEALSSLPPKQRAEIQPGTVRHVIEDYLGSKQYQGLADTTRSGYRNVCDALGRLYGDVPLKDITREFVNVVRDAHEDSPRAADMRVAILRILFKHALNYPARFRLPGFWVNPALNVNKLKNKKNIREYPPWPQDVYDDVVAAANPALRRLIIAARNTGQRGADVAGMKLTDYNDGEVFVTQDKTDVKVWIPATPDLIELIAGMPKDNILLFPNSAGRKWEASAWGSEIRKLMKKTGHSGYSLHGLRKNATIELLEADCTPDQVKAITGHITTQMIEKYGREVSKRRQGKAAIVKLVEAIKNKG
jgi:integrase